MAKTVQLSDEIYHDLAAEKRDHESFTDVIRRLLSSRKDPLALLDLPPLDPGFDFDDFDRTMRQADEQRTREIWAHKAPSRTASKE